uniref:SAM domain-containing protein n=2 Tax=Lygus hesperus TaxID=30085 RepID=A0A0K8SUD2_LYGHE
MDSTQPLIVLMLWCLAVLTANALELKASDSKALTYIWDVNLDEFNGTNNLLSPRFTTWNGTVEEPWQLWFNLHGASYLNKECLDLYLVHRKSHHVKIVFTLLLFNQKDEKDSASHHWQGVTFKDSSTGHGTGPCFKGDIANSPPKGIYTPGRGYVVEGKMKLGVRIPTDPIPIKPTIELLQEQLRHLESDKKSLTLQVSNLTSQVEAKSNKINDLEETVSEQKKQISASEDLLQREMLTRSGLETQKLELLAVVSELKRHETVLEKDNIELRDRLAEEKRKNKPPLAPRNHLYPQSSTPNSMNDIQNMARGLSPSPSPVSLGHGPRKLEFTDSSPSPQRIGGGQYRSLPREHQQDPAGLRRAVVFGRPVDQPRCSSVPNLDTETTVMNELNETDTENYSKEPSPSMQTSAPKGIRKIFGKMKRSGSGNLDDIPSDEPFTRGGVRSTAGPRLCGNSQAISHSLDSASFKRLQIAFSCSSIRNDKPFSEWSSENICEWLKEMGLDSSVPEARRWVKSGQMLLTATPHEIDKELNVKSGLLRKKLHLALEAERGPNAADPMLDCAGRLEPGWVLRWLDDIGLPQYKGSFMSARLDGRVLHRLSLDDLQGLHINLALHVASIKAGIHVLRKEKFDPHCLIRRSDPENETEDRVELWTNHRVMEWLRVVDLAEYAPNLRGSGVHGGLMVHEDRFTETLLASVLSIPSEKTLLRRHLATHFKELLGADIIQKKREAETTLGYIPLTLSLKAKVPKKSQFTLKRKKSKYEDEEELVCPLNDSKSTPEVSKSRGCLS